MTDRAIMRLCRNRKPATLADYMAQQRAVIQKVAAREGVTELTATLRVAVVYRFAVRHPADADNAN